jgi:hypothetical protein
MDLRVHNNSGFTFYVADLDRRNSNGDPVRISPIFFERKHAELFRDGVQRGAELARQQ